MDLEYSIVKDGSKYCLACSYNGKDLEIELDSRAVKDIAGNLDLKNINFVCDEKGDGVYGTVNAKLMPAIVEPESVWMKFWNFVKSVFVNTNTYSYKDKRDNNRVHVLGDGTIIIMVDK